MFLLLKDPEDSPKPTPKSSLTTNLLQKAKRQNNTFPLFAEGLTRNRTAQEKVLALEQQVLMLTKELKSQKVSSVPREAPGSSGPL